MSNNKSKSHQNFTSISRAVFRDEELRAVKSPKVWRELKKAQTLGLSSMNLLAQACKMTLIVRARAVEKINIMDQTLDAVGRLSMATPNIDKSGDKAIDWIEENPDIENKEKSEDGE